MNIECPAPQADRGAIPADALRDFAARLLNAVGVRETEAAIVADVLVSTDLRGVDSHGLARLPVYVDALARDMINARPNITVEPGASGVARVDGDNGLGFLAAQRAMVTAIDLAAVQGIGVAAVHRSNHFGAAGHYAAHAAARGSIGLVLSNASPTMAAFGGREPILGTNPLAVAIPRRDAPPIIHDMATASIARGRLRLAGTDDEPLPEGLAVTREGLPARTVGEALDGVLLPFGGAKGGGLALIISILAGVLSGAGFGRGVRTMYSDSTAHADVGHLFLALDIEAFMPREAFFTRLEDMLAQVKEGAPAVGFREILLPGERAARIAAERAVTGIPLAPATVRSLKEKADALGIALPAL